MVPASIPPWLDGLVTCKPKTLQAGRGLFYENNRKQIRSQTDTKTTEYCGHELDHVAGRTAKGCWSLGLEKTMECSQLLSYYRSLEDKKVERGADAGRLVCQLPKGSSSLHHSKTLPGSLVWCLELRSHSF